MTKQEKILVAGIGPGSESDITPAVIAAIKNSQVVIGYKYYFQLMEKYLLPGAQCIDTGMRGEVERARMAFVDGDKGYKVVVIS